MKVFQIRQDDRFAWYETDQEQMERMVNVCGWQGRVLELASTIAADAVSVTAAELSCVINWLEGGRDPKDAAKELRLYCERAWAGAQPVQQPAPVLSSGGEKPAGFATCPISGRPFWGNIDHPERGMIATYGGPFDTYSIPYLSDDDELRVERFDQDMGDWVEGGEPSGWFYREQQPEYAAPVAAPVDVPAASVQPIVSNGPYTFPIGEDGEYEIRDATGRKVGEVLYYGDAWLINNALRRPEQRPDSGRDAGMMGAVSDLAWKWHRDAVKDGFACSEPAQELFEALGWPADPGGHLAAAKKGPTT